MAIRSEAYDFACRWIPRFLLRDLIPSLQDPDFMPELAALVSNLDADTVSGNDNTNATIRHLLSSLASHWECLAGTGDSGILDESECAHFHEELERLARLSDPSRFTGVSQSMSLVSHADVFLCPEEGEEIEQHFTLHSNGWASVSRYSFSGNPAANQRSGFTRLRINPELAEDLLETAAEFWRSSEELQLDRDSASWDLRLMNSVGQSYRLQASPDAKNLAVCQKLSDRFRDSLGLEDLFLFDDGQRAERIEQISVDYQRTTTGEADHTETLVLNRAAGMLEQQLREGGRTVIRQIVDGDGIRRLLDSLDPGKLFNCIEGHPDDIVPLPHETREYHITVDFRLGPRRVIEGSFDQKGLPDDWDDFGRKICSFIDSSDRGETFNPGIYGRSRRRRDELIFLGVEFPSSGKRYTYLSDDDSIVVGDAVIVPVGDEGHEVPVVVEQVDYCAAADAPYPLDKIKRMIRRCSDEEY